VMNFEGNKTGVFTILMGNKLNIIPDLVRGLNK